MGLSEIAKQDAMSFVVQCSICRACEGAAYQSSPVSYSGSLSGRVLLLAQNPGEFDPSSDPNRKWWGEVTKTKSAQNDALLMKTWYSWDFDTSNGANRIGWLLGKDWLKNGDFLFSNSVRCRTPKNANPSIEMLSNCTMHTSKLIELWQQNTFSEGRRLLILMGSLAVASFKRLYAIDGEESIEWGSSFKVEGLGTVLPIKHYAAWRGDSNRYKLAFQAAYKELEK